MAEICGLCFVKCVVGGQIVLTETRWRRDDPESDKLLARNLLTFFLPVRHYTEKTRKDGVYDKGTKYFILYRV